MTESTSEPVPALSDAAGADADQLPDEELPDEELPDEERHRPFVRELDRSLSASYGYGGGAVLLVTVLVVVIGAALGSLWSLSTWFFAITIGLIGLFVLSAVLRRRRARLRVRFEDYCRLNGLSDAGLREYFVRDGTYPFFTALFEGPDRRRSASLEGPTTGSAPTTSQDDRDRA